MPKRFAASRPVQPAGSEWLLLLSAVAVLALVLVQCVVSISPNIYWDISPFRSPQIIPNTVFGPTAYAWLNTLSVAAAALALGAHLWVGGAFSWPAISLAFFGSAWCVWQMPGQVGSLSKCAAWIGAVMLALAAHHLGRHPVVRRFMAAALVAMLVPFVIQSVWYVTVEHPATVRFYQERAAQTIAEHGWDWNSPQHLGYQRRLEYSAALGAFGLSNVYGSLAAALTVVTLGWGISSTRQGSWRSALVLLTLTTAGLVVVMLARSRGAALSLAAVVSVLAAVWWRTRKPRWPLRWLSLVALLLIALTAAAVLVRGWLGPPPTAAGERSMFFRYYYWQGAVRMIAQHRAVVPVFGVGPGEFKEFYSAVKNTLSPEDIVSTHNVFIDYVVMLGLGGLAWSVLLLLWLWQAGRQAGSQLAAEPQVENYSAARDFRRWLPWAAALTVLVFGTQYIMQLPVFLPETALFWMFGMGGFIGLTCVLAATPWVADAWLTLGLFGAATVLLMHNQIEMTFFHPGAMAAAWVLMGLAAAPLSPVFLSQSPGRERLHRGSWLVVLGMVSGAMGLLYAYVIPISQQQDWLGSAAAQARQGQAERTAELLENAVAIPPTDPTAYQALVEAYLTAAAKAAGRGDTEQAGKFIYQAQADLGRAPSRWRNDVVLWRLQAQVAQFAADSLRESGQEDAAIQAWRRVMVRQPYDLHAARTLGDFLWRLGRRDAARQEYRRCLEISDHYYLDPLAQLPDRQRKVIEGRLAVAASPPQR